MIRLAFLAVLAIGGLIAFGGFVLVRGGGGDDTAQAPQESVAPHDAPTPAAPLAAPTPLYFLQGIDLSTGSVVVVLRDSLTGQGDMFVRDHAVIAAAQNVAYVNTSPGAGSAAVFLTTPPAASRPDTALADIYHNDKWVGALECVTDPCEPFVPDQTVVLGPLGDAAQPLVATVEQHSAYDSYITSINAINSTPDFKFLDARPPAPFPLPRQTARLDVNLPTLIVRAGNAVDQDVAGAVVRGIIDPLLPEGASIENVTFTRTGPGVVADMDSETPVTQNGAPIPFPDVEFTNLRITITGAATLNAAALDSLTSQPLQRTDYADAFAAFTTARLQSDCSDCFTLKMQGDFYDAATITASQPEAYPLAYYDLRDAP